MTRLPFFVLLLLSLLLTGCATLLNDPEQPVAFDTDPPGAFVSVDGIRMGTTPCVIPVPRKGGDKIISFEKPGYKTEMMNMRNTLDAALAGNLLFGGFIGLAIDGVSGRGGGYQKSLRIVLEPGSGVNDRREGEKKDTQNASTAQSAPHPANSTSTASADPAASDFEQSLRSKDAGELAQLAQFYEDLLRVEPNGIGARRNLAMIRYQQGQYDEAWKHVKHLRLLGTNVPGDFESRLAAAMPEPE